MDKRLLDILCCPVTRESLRLLDPAQLAALNHGIDNGQVHNGAGTQIRGAVAAGLITRDGRTIYRIEDDIPVMLADEAISASQLAGLVDA